MMIDNELIWASDHMIKTDRRMSLFVTLTRPRVSDMQNVTKCEMKIKLPYKLVFKAMDLRPQS